MKFHSSLLYGTSLAALAAFTPVATAEGYRNVMYHYE